MGLGSWFAERRPSWRPVPATRTAVFFWIGLLVFVVMLTVFQVWLAFGPGSHLKHARQGLLLDGGLILVCLSGIALRTRFQLTARLLSLAVFVVVGVYFYLRYTS